MAKTKTIYTCTECGGQSPKWQGQCPACNAWNTLVETIAESAKPRFASLAATSTVQLLHNVEGSEESRIATDIGELDRVLGGGLVPGGVVLIGGDPGIGKSTLLLQALAGLSGRMNTLVRQRRGIGAPGGVARAAPEPARNQSAGAAGNPARSDPGASRRCANPKSR